MTIAQPFPDVNYAMSKCQQYVIIADGQNSENDNQQDSWTLDVIRNCLLSLSFFTSSYFGDSIETGFIFFRIIVVVADLITIDVGINRSCDFRVVLWSFLFILVNAYKLIQAAYKSIPTRLVIKHF